MTLIHHIVYCFGVLFLGIIAIGAIAGIIDALMNFRTRWSRSVDYRLMEFRRELNEFHVDKIRWNSTIGHVASLRTAVAKLERDSANHRQ